jgi:hypothetical protein
MRRATRLTHACMSLGIVAVLAFPTLGNAQGAQGQDAVYNSSNGVVGSSSFIDASMFAGAQNPNICAVLHSILNSNSYPATGAVIDARGLANSTPPTSMTCTAANPSPWAGIANPLPSTILLPATGATPIVIPSGSLFSGFMARPV